MTPGSRDLRLSVIQKLIFGGTARYKVRNRNRKRNNCFHERVLCVVCDVPTFVLGDNMASRQVSQFVINDKIKHPKTTFSTIFILDKLFGHLNIIELTKPYRTTI